LERIIQILSAFLIGFGIYIIIHGWFCLKRGKIRGSPLLDAFQIVTREEHPNRFLFYVMSDFVGGVIGILVGIFLIITFLGSHKTVGPYLLIIILGFCFVGIPVLLDLYFEKRKSKEKVEMRDIEEKILKK
jgi:hypothetical protein